MMKKIVCAGCLFLLISFCLQAETFVVASYNIRNANQGDSTNGNGWGQRYPYIASLMVLIFLERRRENILNCRI
mgnify:CR=1 FL=1